MREVKPARQAVQDRAHVGERMMNLGHVAPHHHVRQTARGGKRLDIFLGGLRVTLVAERQGAIQKLFAGLGADLDQLRDREFLQSRARLADPLQILANDPGIDLADRGQRRRRCDDRQQLILSRLS